GTGDSTRQNLRIGCVSAKCARYGCGGCGRNAGVVSQTVRQSDLTSEFERVSAPGPTQCVGIRPQISDVMLVVRDAVEHLVRLKVHCACSQTNVHGKAAEIGEERKRILSGFGIVERIECVSSDATHPCSGFIHDCG